MLNSHGNTTESACGDDRTILTKYSMFFIHSVQDENFLKKVGKISYQGSKDIAENVNT